MALRLELISESDLATEDINLSTEIPVNPGSDSTSVQPEKLTRKKWLVLVCLLTLGFLNSSCYALLSPFFPEEASKKGLNVTKVGVVFGIFEAIGMVASPVFGKYVTRIGAKPMCVAGVMVCAVCSALFGLLEYAPSGDTYFTLCLLTRSFEALGSAAFFTSSFTIFSVMFSDRVSQVFGFQEMMSSLGFIVSPLIGGLLYEAGGYGLPFYLMSALLITFAVICIFILPPMDKGVPSTGSFFSLLLIPDAVWTSLIISLTSFTMGFFYPVWQPFLKGFFGLTPFYVGLTSTTVAVFYCVPTPLWGHFAGKTRMNRLLMIQLSCLVISAAYFAIGPAPFFDARPNLWLTLVSAAVMFTAFGPLVVPQFEELLDAAKRGGMPDNVETNGKVSGLYKSTFSFGAFSSPLVAGALYDHYGFGWASALYGIAMLLVVLISQVFLMYRVPGRVNRDRIERLNNTDDDS